MALHNADEKRINVLKKRRDYLKKRIYESDERLTYDESEFMALGWAIRNLTTALEEKE